MRKRWISYLLALFALLWAKLPGPQTQRESKPSSKFRVRRKGGIVEISTKAVELPLLSEQITGITVQEVKPQPSGEYTADIEPLRSRVEIKITKPYTAELRDLKPEVGEQLLKGSGQIAIVTGIVKGERFEKQNEIYARGKGRGVWEILE